MLWHLFFFFCCLKKKKTIFCWQNSQAFTVAEVVQGKVKPDVRADAEEMLNKLDDAAGGKLEKEDQPKVDDNCEIKNLG